MVFFILQRYTSAQSSYIGGTIVFTVSDLFPLTSLIFEFGQAFCPIWNEFIKVLENPSEIRLLSLGQYICDVGHHCLFRLCQNLDILRGLVDLNSMDSISFVSTVQFGVGANSFM